MTQSTPPDVSVWMTDSSKCILASWNVSREYWIFVHFHKYFMNLFTSKPVADRSD